MIDQAKFLTLTIAKPDDILIWPCGTYCERHEYEAGGYSYMSDDHDIIFADTPEHEAFHEGLEAQVTINVFTIY